MKLHGYDGSFVVNGNQTAELRTWGTNRSVDMSTGVAKGESVVTARARAKTIKLSLTFFLDPSDTSGQAALIAGTTISNLELYPAGSSSGDRYWTVSEAVVESDAIESPDELCTYSVEVHCNADLVPAQVV